GGWVGVRAIGLLMLWFARSECDYANLARELRLGKTPPAPRGRESVVLVPTTTVSLLTERAMSAALSLGQTVVAIAVAGDEQERDRIKHEWATWRCDVPIEVIVDHRRSLVRTVVRYVEAVDRK